MKPPRPVETSPDTGGASTVAAQGSAGGGLSASNEGVFDGEDRLRKEDPRVVSHQHETSEGGLQDDSP